MNKTVALLFLLVCFGALMVDSKKPHHSSKSSSFDPGLSQPLAAAGIVVFGIALALASWRREPEPQDDHAVALLPQQNPWILQISASSHQIHSFTKPHRLFLYEPFIGNEQNGDSAVFACLLRRINGGQQLWLCLWRHWPSPRLSFGFLVSCGGCLGVSLQLLSASSASSRCWNRCSAEPLNPSILPSSPPFYAPFRWARRPW